MGPDGTRPIDQLERQNWRGQHCVAGGLPAKQAEFAGDGWTSRHQAWASFMCAHLLASLLVCVSWHLKDEPRSQRTSSCACHLFVLLPAVLIGT
ncbi:hypothetical protein K456DRAFT_1629058 [Colletotrichum gloeosporioides 23]|nr:hypothetical protein K456DRAFT_1629058 [Colletotrichum gloeosporioides 23]